MKVLVIGESVLEITSLVNESVSDGKKIRLQEKIECGGGHAGNVAYLLGKWGVETYIASMMGADDASSKIKKEFESIGVKTDYIETSYDKQTGINLVLVNNTTKENTIYEIDSNAFLKKYSFVVEPDVIVSDGLDLNASMAAFDKFANKERFLLATRVTNEVNELCRYVNYIIFNRETAEGISGLKIDYNNSSTLVNLYNKLLQKYSNANIIVTLGERGCIYSINGQIKIMPPVKVDIASTYGAGDAFGGAFIYAMARKFGLEKSICYATIAASLSIGKMTSRLSFPSLTEVSTYYDGKFGAVNNPNNTSEENLDSPLKAENDIKNESIQSAQNSNANENAEMTPTSNSESPEVTTNEVGNNDNGQNA